MNKIINFPTDMKSIWQKVSQIDPVKYMKTRNYKNGAVTYLSPYISRGIISTKQILQKVKENGFKEHQYTKFEQELAWREFWQRVWQEKGDKIYWDLKHKQAPIKSKKLPSFLNNDNCGIEAIDKEIANMKEIGYMHNHMRMYLASVVCNIGQFHWKAPADWFHYHSLDGDVASNYLSWQWVAGSNANKKYIFNQGNLNKFFQSKQKNTFLDKSYDAIQQLVNGKGLDFPSEELVLKTELPQSDDFEVKNSSICIYNYYNLDPYWLKENSTPVLLLEPSKFEKHPVSSKCIKFMLDFNKQNIQANVFTGEFEELIKKYNPDKVYFKEHPLNSNYKGIEEPRDWMFNDHGKYNGFFSFWKKSKGIKNDYNSYNNSRPFYPNRRGKQTRW